PHPKEVEYQELLGFGGAFTEAGAVTLDKMSEENRNEIIDAYFDSEKGLNYSICRTHINSCDFATGNYHYLQENDTEFKSFSIERDRQSLIPFIKDAQKKSKKELKIFASPWSPPGWMKTSGKMNQGGKLKKEFRELWAKYYVKYIEEYAKEGIDIWGITVQNEPKAVQTWDSCVYTAEEERDFVKNYLGPILKDSYENIKIIVWDHNKERVFDRADCILSDPSANKYVWGIGFHWYSGDHFEALQILHDRYPDKKLIFTEGCREGKAMGYWNTGESYAHDIIGDLNNGSVAWVDWNMVLDEMGGPNHVGNYCNAPIIADTKNDQVNYETSYYYLGHFSKFISPGSKRIGFSRFDNSLELTTFKTPEGKVVAVIMNRNDFEIPFVLRTKYGIVETAIKQHAIMTIIY
ncbi:MAG: glycoside hydrolase family 30 protein, partial [bacterium]